jgi:hypothetical protein
MDSSFAMVRKPFMANAVHGATASMLTMRGKR